MAPPCPRSGPTTARPDADFFPHLLCLMCFCLCVSGVDRGSLDSWYRASGLRPSDFDDDEDDEDDDDDDDGEVTHAAIGVRST